MRRWHGPWIPAIVAVLCFANSLFNDFAYDDQYIIRHNPNIHSLANFRAIWLTDWWYFAGAEVGLAADLRDPARDRLYRPLTVFTFALNYAMHGLHPLGYHAVNVLLHAFVTLLVWHFAQRLFGDLRVSSVGALLFAVHPIHAEAVANVVGRAELLAAALLLLGLLALLPSRGLPDIKRIAFAGAAGFAAILAKETAICFPLLAAIVLWWRVRECGETRLTSRIWLTVAPAILLPIGIYFAMRYVALDGHLIRTSSPSWVFNPIVDATAVGRIVFPFSVLGHYARLIVAPIRLSCDYGLAIFDPKILITAETFFGMLAACGLILAATRFCGRRVAVLAILFLASYALISNTLLLIGVSVGERLFYWPSVFVLIAAALGIRAFSERAAASETSRLKFADQSPKRERADVGDIGPPPPIPHALAPGARMVTVLVIAVLAALGLRSATRSTDWADDYTLFSVDAETWPNGAQLQQSLARLHLLAAERTPPGESRDLQLRRAEQLLDRAMRVAPFYSTAIQLRGLAHAMRGDKTSAIRLFEQALLLDPTDRFSQRRLDLLRSGGEFAARTAVLEQALATRPTDANLRLELVRACVAAGDNTAALKHARAANMQFPDNVEILRALGEALAINMQGDEAVATLREVVRLAPKDWAAHANLTKLLAETDPPAALQHAETALRLQPDDLRAQINFAAALALNRRNRESLERYRTILMGLPADHPQRALIENLVKGLQSTTP